MTRNLSVWNSLRPFSVGFDSIFDEFDRMLDSTERYNSNYPPYNIHKLNDTNFTMSYSYGRALQQSALKFWAKNKNDIKSLKKKVLLLKKNKPSEVKEDNNELWEIGASINKVNDNSYREPITIKKYITEENDIKVIIGENIYLKSPDIIMENVTAKLVSNRIRE